MIQKGNATLFAHATSSKVLFCAHYVSNVIYHKVSHGTVSYRFNGENVTVMLEIQYVLFLFSKFNFCQCKHGIKCSLKNNDLTLSY